MSKLYIYTSTPAKDDKINIIPNKIYEYDTDIGTINVDGVDLYVFLNSSYWASFNSWKVLKDGDRVHTLFNGLPEANFKFDPSNNNPFVMTGWIGYDWGPPVDMCYKSVSSYSVECFFGYYHDPDTDPDTEEPHEPVVETEENPFFNVMGEDKGITIVQQTIIINVIQENGD